jgi:hypothetical protein
MHDIHCVQIRLPGGVLLGVETKKKGLTLKRAARIARRIRRALRLPSWSPEWDRLPRAYRSLVASVARWHDDPRHAVVEVVHPGDGPHGYAPVLLLPVALPSAAAVACRLLTLDAD